MQRSLGPSTFITVVNFFKQSRLKHCFAYTRIKASVHIRPQEPQQLRCVGQPAPGDLKRRSDRGLGTTYIGNYWLEDTQ